MKSLLILSFCLLVACGGGEEDVYLLEDWQIDVELCEAQDGTTELFHVTSIDTGETTIEARCTFDKNIDKAYCKPGSLECPNI